MPDEYGFFDAPPDQVPVSQSSIKRKKRIRAVFVDTNYEVVLEPFERIIGVEPSGTSLTAYIESDAGEVTA